MIGRSVVLAASAATGRHASVSGRFQMPDPRFQICKKCCLKFSSGIWDLASGIWHRLACKAIVQSTVTTARHISTSPRGLILHELVESIRVPVLVGNTVGYQAAKELLESTDTRLGISPQSLVEILRAAIAVEGQGALADITDKPEDLYREAARNTLREVDNEERADGVRQVAGP